MNTLTDTLGVTWEDVCDTEKGHVYADAYENGVRFLLMRGPVALCAYIGVPKDHPLAGFDYDAIPLDCHGGLTFSKEGEGGESGWPDGWYWYGWDYAHAGDASAYGRLVSFDRDEKKWTPDDVLREIWGVTYQFAKLRTLAEWIAHPPYPK